VGECPGEALAAVYPREDLANRLPGEAPEREDRAGLREEPKFPLEERCAVRPFGRGWAIVGRRAPYGRGEVQVSIAKSVIPPDRGGLVGEARLVERAYEERGRSIAGKHASGPIRAMGGRGEPDGDQPGPRVAEAGDRTSPILVVPKLALFRLGHPFAVADESRAPDAGHNVATDGLERVGHTRGEGRSLLGLPPSASLPVVTESDLPL